MKEQNLTNGDYSVSLIADNAKKYIIGGFPRIALPLRSKYKLKLYNKAPTRCDALVFIDDIFVGVWRIESGGSVIVDKPVQSGRDLVFGENDDDFVKADGNYKGTAEMGFIKVVFKPELETHQRFSCAHGCGKGYWSFMYGEPETIILKGCDNAKCYYGSGATLAPVQHNSITNDSLLISRMAPAHKNLRGPQLVNGDIRSGQEMLADRATRLTDKNKHLENIDYSKVKTIQFRLMLDDESQLTEYTYRTSVRSVPTLNMHKHDKFLPGYDMGFSYWSPNSPYPSGGF